MIKPLRAAIVFAALAVAPLNAQQSQPETTAYELPQGWVTRPTPGILGEPSILGKLAMSTDTSIGGEPRDGFYVETGNMITGEGWISAGPGYRTSVLDGRGRIDLSAAVSWNLYKNVQASFELPHLANDRVTIGAQGSYQDVLQVEYFGIGNDSSRSAQSAYRFNNLDIIGFGHMRANSWLSIDGRAGWIPRPDLSSPTGPRVNYPSTLDKFTEATAPGIRTQPPFVHGDVSVVADTRDHAGHPTAGGYYRAGAAIYSDRSAGAYSFRRYEAEAAQFVPLFTPKLILALHAWDVFTDTSNGAVVPFYLLPSLGGKNTLRGYYDYRFHDNDMQNVTAESRLALLTHMDLAAFADAGKVAHEISGLDYRHLKTSFGGGVRFHNATSTLLRIDIGHGVEGWRLFIKVTDSFKRSTPASGRSSVVPFVP